MQQEKEVGEEDNNNINNNNDNNCNNQVAESSVVFLPPGQEDPKPVEPKESLFTLILDRFDGAKVFYAMATSLCVFVIFVDTLKCILDENELQKLFKLFRGQLWSLPLFFQLYLTLHVIILVIIYPAGRFCKKQPVILIASFLLLIILGKGQLVYFALLPWAQSYRPLSMGLSFAIAFETIRLGMKSISFLVECNRCPSHVATLGNFYYHLFSPILVYKSNFERSSGPIKWTKVAQYLIEFVVVVYILGLWIKNILVPALKPLTQSYLDKKTLPVTYWLDLYLVSGLSVVIYLVIIAYSIIHSFNNLNSELLKFEDRMFYKAWWRSRSIGEWFRKWEFAKHTWIREYIFKPIADKSVATRIAALALTLVVSGLYHDVVTTMMFGYFSPVFTTTMAISAVLCGILDQILSKLPLRLFWTLHFFATLFGIGLASMYLVVEFQIRTLCPARPEDSYIKDFVTPRTFRCLSY